jgi:hypothetical protein
MAQARWKTKQYFPDFVATVRADGSRSVRLQPDLDNHRE